MYIVKLVCFTVQRYVSLVTNVDLWVEAETEIDKDTRRPTFEKDLRPKFGSPRDRGWSISILDLHQNE